METRRGMGRRRSVEGRAAGSQSGGGEGARTGEGTRGQRRRGFRGFFILEVPREEF